MSELLLALRNLCLLRIGPQDLPFSPALLVACVVANVVLDGLTGSLLGMPVVGLGSSLISLAVVLAGVWMLLNVYQLPERFVQTALAMVATTLLFSLLVAPLQVLIGPIEDPSAVTGDRLLLLLLMAGLGCWALAVTAHILRNAVERSFGMGLLLALALNFAAMIMIALLMPVPSS